MIENIEPAHARQHPARKKFAERRQNRQREEEESFDRLYARFRVHLLEGERTRRSVLGAIAEREALRQHRRDLARRAMFIHGVSHGPLDDPLGPHAHETLSEFAARVDRETPRLVLADFEKPRAWFRDEPPSPWSVPGSMPALPTARRKRSRK